MHILLNRAVLIAVAYLLVAIARAIHSPPPMSDP